MRILFTLLSQAPYIEFPHGTVGWFGWLCLLGVVGFFLMKWQVYNRHMGRRERGIFILLAIFVPLTSLFIGLRLSGAQGLTPPELPKDPTGQLILLFSAIPWLLAGGLLGPLPAASLAIFSGLIQAAWDTHNPFTPLELALLATWFGALVRQRYRTLPYRVLSHPLVASALLAIVYPFIYLVDTILLTRGPLVSRLDYGLTHLGSISLAMAVELLLAGLFAEVAAATLQEKWGSHGPLVPAPPEKSLQARFVYSMAPVAFVLVIALMIGDWIVAGSAAREMLRARMGNAIDSAAQSVPFFQETGQNLIGQLARDQRLTTASPAVIATILQEDLRAVPYFRQLFILDANGNPVGGYPMRNYTGGQAPVEEQVGVQLALNGVPFQSFTVPPVSSETAAQISFVATIYDRNNNPSGVLIGRTDLASNPFTQPVINSLNSLAGSDGQGMLIDENGRILYHPDRSLIMTQYDGRTSDVPLFYDDTAPDGTRRLVYYQRALGRPWAVALRVPASRAQQLALTIAAPLLAMILILSVVALVVLRLGLGKVTSSLQALAQEAGKISRGQLDNPLALTGEDEVGQLRRSFEHMRVGLKGRLEDLNRILQVSQGVASTLEMAEAVKPILTAALTDGASSARVVLDPDIVPDLDPPMQHATAFGVGAASDLYAELDEQILMLARQQERVVVTNPSRPRYLTFPSDAPKPEALVAFPLRHESQYYGTLWVAYDRPRQFSEEEIRFLVTLSGYAALAAANSILYLNAEIGRQRLAAILASTPDPVLVIDQHHRMLLSNPAAWQTLGVALGAAEGQTVDKVIPNKPLQDILQSSNHDAQSVEITLPGGRVFLTTSSPIIHEGQSVGRVCVMRDVTRFKELDTLKSEFVSMVSHDLRSPLTLIHGYSTMLEMVGELNEQQANYIRLILSGVENMDRLVSNLLDLGRIEAGQALQINKVSPRELVEGVVSGFQGQAVQKHIHLSIEPQKAPLPLIEADQALLHQALQNLVENAIKFTRPDGRILVRANLRGDRVVFEVIDTGIGISPMDQARLFEKFYTTPQHSFKDSRGSGLGLAIVRSVAERHGGQVWVESQLGKGSRFCLAIPVQQPRP